MARRIIFRALVVVLSLLLAAALAAALFPAALAEGVRRVVAAWPVITPPPPVIAAPRGPLPEGPVGLQQWVQAPGADYQQIETSGFLFQISNGQVVGVTTAHSLFLEDPHRRLERVGLRSTAPAAWLWDADTYWGVPGVPFAGDDLTVDYVLLKLTNPPDLSVEWTPQVLTPDPRGAPQPGERVTLYSGLGDGAGGPLPWAGTVLSVQPAAVVVYMDAANLNPAGISGSPILSQHTGRVVGMALGATLRGSRWLIGVHPIGHLVQLAESASTFPRIADFVR